MNEWHYPRPELAEQYIGMLGVGISSSLSIVAPRRKGKTLFVLQDLAPSSRKKKYLPIYASLWQNINAPHEGLIQALEEAIDVIDKGSAFSRLLKAKIKKATISNELLGKMEVEFADNPSQATSKELAYLDKLLGVLESKAGRKTILLIVDEVQHLSTSPAFEPLTHALRTMLDKRQGRVKSIFTGSSRHYMNLLFNKSQSPFYHFVETVPFPDLDAKFIEFIRSKLANEHNIAVALPALSKAFEHVDRSPYWLMKMISLILTYKMSVEQAHEQIIDLMDAAEGFEEISKKMKPIDRLVFLALCEGKNPYSKEMMVRVEKETDVKGIPPNIQRAIKRLSETNLISQHNKGDYHIEKPGLRRYLEMNIKGK